MAKVSKQTLLGSFKKQMRLTEITKQLKNSKRGQML